jgi:hypothetical protein
MLDVLIILSTTLMLQTIIITNGITAVRIISFYLFVNSTYYRCRRRLRILIAKYIANEIMQRAIVGRVLLKNAAILNISFSWYFQPQNRKVK